MYFNWGDIFDHLFESWSHFSHALGGYGASVAPLKACLWPGCEAVLQAFMIIEMASLQDLLNSGEAVSFCFFQSEHVPPGLCCVRTVWAKFQMAQVLLWGKAALERKSGSCFKLWLVGIKWRCIYWYLKSIVKQLHFCKWEVLSAIPVRIYSTPHSW